MKHRVTLLFITLVLTACSTTGPFSTPSRTGPAAVLLAQAEEQHQLGHLTKSIALVERAVRIEPRNAYAWHRLAQLNFDAGNHRKAEQFARRSNQFAGKDRRLINQNLRLIEAIQFKQ